MDRRIHRFRSEKVEVTVLQYDDSDDHRGLPNELTHFGNLRLLLMVLTLRVLFCDFLSVQVVYVQYVNFDVCLCDYLIYIHSMLIHSIRKPRT